MGQDLDMLLPWRSPKELVLTLSYKKRALDDIYTVNFHMQSGKEHILSYSRRKSKMYENLLCDMPMLDLRTFDGSLVVPRLEYEHVEAREPVEQTTAAYWQTKYKKIPLGAVLCPEDKAERFEQVEELPRDLFGWEEPFGYPVALWEAVNDIKGRDDTRNLQIHSTKVDRRENLDSISERYDRS